MSSKDLSLIAQLLAEITERRNSDATLYAALLARALVTTDEELMREYGQQLFRSAVATCMHLKDRGVVRQQCWGYGTLVRTSRYNNIRCFDPALRRLCNKTN